MEFRLLNKLDSAIFGSFNPNHKAITGKTFVHTLIGGAVVSLIIFAFQMFSSNRTLIEVIAGIGLVVLLGWIVKLSLPSITSFTTWGPRIMYSIYILILSGLAFMIAMWMVMIALVLIVLYIIIKVFFSSSSKSSKARFIYKDGTEVNAKKTGTGICGETYYEGENGDRAIKY